MCAGSVRSVCVCCAGTLAVRAGRCACVQCGWTRVLVLARALCACVRHAVRGGMCGGCRRYYRGGSVGAATLAPLSQAAACGTLGLAAIPGARGAAGPFGTWAGSCTRDCQLQGPTERDNFSPCRVYGSSLPKCFFLPFFFFLFSPAGCAGEARLTRRVQGDPTPPKLHLPGVSRGVRSPGIILSPVLGWRQARCVAGRAWARGSPPAGERRGLLLGAGRLGSGRQ